VGGEHGDRAVEIGAAQRADAAPGSTAWITFFSIVLSLLAAVVGSAIGQRGGSSQERD
jgi:hypothetical protein